ncbi:MAG TPA: TfoX/Sxy family protein [Marmoricola sp.]|nr:TfoX/Sxy family protein [Marmoricola sp.]
MAYDEQLAERLREAVAGEPGITEKRMFGGVAFLADGNLAVAASSQGGLMLRCDSGQSTALLEEAGVTRVEMRGREMDGWLRVESEAVVGEAELQRWLAIGIARARSLPAK